MLARALGPLTAMGAAVGAQKAGFGLFNVLDAPGPVVALVCLAVLDLSLYVQHRLLHAVPLLWRLHAPHHADRMLDVTTGLRFHPLEYLTSMVWKAAVAALLGAPVWIVVAFEAALNAFAMFTHANVRLAGPMQRVLGLVLVTPRAHRLHHDRDAGRASGNYGFSINLWDRLLGTWRIGPEPERLGIEGGPDNPSKLGVTLVEPLR
jgi:sterol desaturase/sphingolipid hydroxylase (fatty acid hydroxylase superfamily)